MRQLLFILVIPALLLAGCSASRVSNKSNPDKTAFADKPHGKDRGSKPSHFGKHQKNNHKDNRTRHFSDKQSKTNTDTRGKTFSSKQRRSGEAPPRDSFSSKRGGAGRKAYSDSFSGKRGGARRSAYSDSFSSKRARRGRGGEADSFSSAVQKRKLKYGKDHFASSVGSKGGPVDDCFSFKVRSHHGGGLGKDAFSSKVGGGFKGNYSDSFAAKRNGRQARSYGKKDAFSHSKRGIRKKNFIGERTALFHKKDKQKGKRKKTQDTLTQSNKAKKAIRDSRSRSPELDLFRGRVLRKTTK